MTTTLPKTPKPRLALANARRGRIDLPPRICIHGVEGVGKTTFALGAPNPYLIGPDTGSLQFEQVTRTPEEVRTWQDVLDNVAALQNESHDYGALVLDPLNWIEPLCWAQTCEENDWQSIEEPGYGIGYNAALDRWRVLLAAIERLWLTKKMLVVITAHSQVKTFKNPEGEDFDRYQIAMNERAAGLWRQWSDDVLFAKHDLGTMKDSKTKRVRGVSTGDRKMYTQWNAAYDAKNRHNLPEEMPLSWSEFYEHVQRATAPDERKLRADELRARIETLLGDIADESYSAKALGYVADAKNDDPRLAEIENRVAARAAAKQPQAAA
jgi:hypothetical protein